MESQIFQPARKFLIEYHEEREAVIRICRDLNAYSKKLIFTFHRITTQDISSELYDQIIPYLEVIAKCLERIKGVFVHSVNFGQFKSSISNATEEMVEAFTFMYFVMTRKLMEYDQMLKFIERIVTENDLKVVLADLWDSQSATNSTNVKLNRLPDQSIQLTSPYTFIYLGDYFMGLFDLTGEIMRYTISNLVDDETKTLSKQSLDNLDFMIQLYKHMNVLVDTHSNLNVNRGVFSNDFHSKGVSTMKKKLEVFKDSLNKIEMTICETVIRMGEKLMD